MSDQQIVISLIALGHIDVISKSVTFGTTEPLHPHIICYKYPLYGFTMCCLVTPGIYLLLIIKMSRQSAIMRLILPSPHLAAHRPSVWAYGLCCVFIIVSIAPVCPIWTLCNGISHLSRFYIWALYLRNPWHHVQYSFHYSS